MTTRKKVLGILEKYRDTYISGQFIGEELKISRGAIWKNINQLRAQGYEIESKTNRGYRLLKGNDKLSDAGIRNYLKKEYSDTEIIVLDSVDSTNSFAKKYAVDREGWMIIVANKQTAGRGRRGRAFSSPENGVYMSMVLRPTIDLHEIYFSTILTVVAVHRVLSRLTDEKIMIKWVNDLFVGNRKICGILTELVSSVESMKVEFVVAGVGINVNSSLNAYPCELDKIVGILEISDLDRNKLIAEIANEAFAIFDNYDKAAIIDEYKSFQLLLGKEVKFENEGKLRTAIALDITENGELLVIDGDEKIILNAGEISVKLSE